MDWLPNLDPHWSWLALGLVLAVAEIAVPGVFLIWLAGAAILTGLVTWVVPIGLPLQIVVFAVLAVASVFLGKRYLGRNPIHEADPGMNDRGARLLGEVVTITRAIGRGTGRHATVIPNGLSAGRMQSLARGCGLSAMMAPYWLWSTSTDPISRFKENRTWLTS